MNTTEKVLIPVIVFFLFGLFLAIRNFVIHPYYNKSNIEYAQKSLELNKIKYAALIRHIKRLVNEDKKFYFDNHPKNGVNLFVLDSNKVKKEHFEPYSKKKDYLVPLEIVQIIKDLKISKINVNYEGNPHFIIIYTHLLNYSMSGKTVSLYHFPDNYKFGFFNNYNTEKELFEEWKNEKNKIWLFKIDSNWIIKSKKRIEN